MKNIFSNEKGPYWEREELLRITNSYLKHKRNCEIPTESFSEEIANEVFGVITTLDNTKGEEWNAQHFKESMNRILSSGEKGDNLRQYLDSVGTCSRI